jgi:uncharacterized membrane-anchored protein YhcB (DUF1043 family)
MIAALAGFVAAGGWVANLGLQQANRRKIEAEAEKAEYDLDETRGANVKTIFATAGEVVQMLRTEVTRLSDRVRDLEELEETRRAARTKCQEELERALARIAVLEGALEHR